MSVSSKVVRSPELVVDRFEDDLENGDGISLVCIYELAKLVEFPKNASKFWIEGSLRQWPDRSGQTLYVRWSCDLAPEFWDGMVWDELHIDMELYLQKLGIPAKVETRVFFRLLYED